MPESKIRRIFGRHGGPEGPWVADAIKRPTPSVRPIGADDVEPVGRFLHRNLNPRVSAQRWEALMRPPWGAVGPNRGFQLVDDADAVVGAYVAVYSPADDPPAVCNLAAFCVLEEHRTHSLRLVRALLRQRGYIFTDLSPSGNVPALNERLGFRRLDVSTRLVPNLPALQSGAWVTAEPGELAGTLTGQDAVTYRDHREAAAARHALVRSSDGYAYLMYRRDRRKHLPVFASPLHVGGDVALLQREWRALAAHLLRQGLLATLAERRVLGFTPPGPGRNLVRPRPKMYRGDLRPGADVHYLYSELTLLEW